MRVEVPPDEGGAHEREVAGRFKIKSKGKAASWTLGKRLKDIRNGIICVCCVV